MWLQAQRLTSRTSHPETDLLFNKTRVQLKHILHLSSMLLVQQETKPHRLRLHHNLAIFPWLLMVQVPHPCNKDPDLKIQG